MLDRLISGAGAVTDLADRAARFLGGRVGRAALGARPGSPIIAVLLVTGAIVLGLVGAEASTDPDPRDLAAADIAGDPDLGSRTYATVDGGVHGSYVETYIDIDGDGEQDPGETGEAWYYFLVDPVSRAGVTVRSDRAPDDVFVLDVVGRLVADPTYIADDLDIMASEIASRGLTVDPTYMIDTTDPTALEPIPLDLAALPAEGTAVSLSATTLSYAGPTCFGMETDPDCLEAPIRFYDVIMFDPETELGIIVYTTQSIDLSPATFTGLLRRDEHAVDEARTTPGLGFEALELTLSDRYLLEDGAVPANPVIAFGVAAVGLGLAALIVIGLVGRYLVYRRDPSGLRVAGAGMDPALGLAPGERLPLRVTGLLRSPAGLVHVREAAADLVRFVTTAAPSAGTTSSTPGPPSTADPLPGVMSGAVAGAPEAVPSTLIVERRDRPEGAALGLGELRRLSAGVVMPFRGPRPAIRVVAGTGPLLLSFDDAAIRDRAAAVLLDETGLTVADGIATDAAPPLAGAPPASRPTNTMEG